MPILFDQILTEYADQAFEAAHLRRNGVHTTRDLVSTEMLAELETTVPSASTAIAFFMYLEVAFQLRGMHVNEYAT